MSQTYAIGCVDCKESLWIAQGHSETLYFYNGDPDTVALFNEFLRKHRTGEGRRHHLIFGENSWLEEVEGCIEDERVFNRSIVFYWKFYRNNGEEEITLREYEGLICPPGTERITDKVRSLLADGWTAVSVAVGQ